MRKDKKRNDGLSFFLFPSVSSLLAQWLPNTRRRKSVLARVSWSLVVLKGNHCHLFAFEADSIQTESTLSGGCHFFLSSVTGSTPTLYSQTHGSIGTLCLWALEMSNANGVTQNSRHAYCLYLLCPHCAPLSCGLHFQNTSSRINLLKILSQEE